MIKTILCFALLIVLGYLMGNISNARIISKLKDNDITKLGSGNPGTMNMARSFGWKWGLLTLVLDILKSAIPCLLALIASRYILQDYYPLIVFLTGFAVVLGHIFPVFYKFKGGKGVACCLGVFAVIHPIWFLISLVFGLIVLLVFKIGSITSFSVVGFLVVVSIILAISWIEIVCVVLLYLILILTHKKNLVRLFKGEENKVYLFKKRDK